MASACSSRIAARAGRPPRRRGVISGAITSSPRWTTPRPWRRRAEFEEPGERLPVYLMCHSTGGQIGALYLSRPEADVDGMITIGSGTPHYIRFAGREYIRLCWGGPVMDRGHGPLATGRRTVGSGAVAASPGGTCASGPCSPATAACTRRRRTSITSARCPVTTPVLMLTCDGDRDCTPDSAMDLASRLPKAARFEFVDRRLGQYTGGHANPRRSSPTVSSRGSANSMPGSAGLDRRAVTVPARRLDRPH